MKKQGLLWILVIAIAISTRLVEARLLHLRAKAQDANAGNALEGVQETPLAGVLYSQAALSSALKTSRKALTQGEFVLAATAAFEARTFAPQNGEAWLLLCKALRELGKGSIQANTTRIWRESALRIANEGRSAAPGVARDLDALLAELLLESYVWGNARLRPDMPELQPSPLAQAIASLDRACVGDCTAQRRFLYAKALLWSLAHPEINSDSSVEDLSARYQLQRRFLTAQRDAWRHRIEALERELPPP